MLSGIATVDYPESPPVVSPGFHQENTSEIPPVKTSELPSEIIKKKSCESISEFSLGFLAGVTPGTSPGFSTSIPAGSPPEIPAKEYLQEFHPGIHPEIISGIPSRVTPKN